MEIVSFEIAKKLKEKGFRKPCIAHYSCLDENVLKFNITTDCIRGSNFKVLNEDYNILIDAPTISQVLKWSREEKGMYIQRTLFEYCYDYCILDTKMVYYDNEHKVLHQGPTGYSYDEAAIAGIEYCLDNLI